eukprot:ANDGO_00445.mRNA.1 Delta(24(24(1)))-sterol reductase
MSEPRQRTTVRSATAGGPAAASSTIVAGTGTGTDGADGGPPKAAMNAKLVKPDYEFGGPLGALGIMTYSHVLLYYVYYCLHHADGTMWFPSSMADVKNAYNTLVEETYPDMFSILLYTSFIFIEAVFAAVLPGLDLRGRPDDCGKRLLYRCNGYLSWYVTLFVIVTSQVTGMFPLSLYYDRIGRIMTVAILFGDLTAVSCYVFAFAARKTHRMSGNYLYDFFMGALLHPRIGILDIKFFAEIRISWYLLFINTVSCASKQYELTGSVSPSMWFLILAHGLYANACAKGEHYVPPTWDIFYEKFGWMLSFWNFAGVPFLYCLQSVFLVVHGDPGLPFWALGIILALYLFAYYIWDTSQSQKNHFRLQFEGTVVNRWTFPRLPWQVLENPKHLMTKAGMPLLIDGWWKYARKIHYTCDMYFALTWGLLCGFDRFLPYFYFIFFTSMIIHRYQRDMHRCALKYGEDWKNYLKVVPHAFIPGII